MYKQSPIRNHRSNKGIKVKHVLQICVLLAVCFWLLYQVKHSNEKRKEFESKDEKVVGTLRSDSELQRFGRKDIPKVTEIANNSVMHDEDGDDKEDEDGKENKHEEDETEKEDAKEEERVRDDEIDEHEPEKTEEEKEEVDEDEDKDKDKEKEEKKSVTEEKHTDNEENEDTHEEELPQEEEEEKSGKEDHTESEKSDDVDKDHGDLEITSDDHEVEKNTRKAQEELYRADDASSEVAHTVQSISQENENVTSDQTNLIYGKINFGEKRETITSENVTELVKPEIQSRDVNSTASNATISEQKDDKVNLTKADGNSLQNSTLPEIPNNSTVADEIVATSFLSNGTQKPLDSNLPQNGTIGIKQASDDKNQHETRESAIISEIVNTNKTVPSSDSSKDNEAIKDAKDSLVDDENGGKKPEDVGKNDENSESHSSEGKKATQHDPIDASDTSEKESRTDLDMLPKIKSDVHNTEDVVAE